MAKVEKAVEGAKKIFDLGSQIHTGFAALRAFFVRQQSSDSDASSEGVQSDKKGRTRADEAMFLSALTLAKEVLSKVDDPDTNPREKYSLKKLNEMGKKVTDVIKSYPVQERIDIILTLGLGEQPYTKKTPTGTYDQNNNPLFIEESFLANVKGITILSSWLTMSKGQIRAEIDSLVNGDQYFKDRLSQAEPHLKAINDALSQTINIKPQWIDESTWADYIPFLGLYLSRRKSKKNAPQNTTTTP